MKASLIFLITILKMVSLFSQQVNKINAGNALLEDKITLPATILVWYDKFDDEHSIKPCGTFNYPKFGPTRALAIDSPMLFVLPIGFQVPYLVYPSDTIVFSNKSKYLPVRPGNPTLSHKNIRRRTNELKFFEQVFDSLGACYGQMSYTVPRSLESLNDLLIYHQNRLQERNSFLQASFNNNDIGDYCYRYAKEFFKYKYYDDLFSSFSEKRFSDSLTRQAALYLADSLIADLNNAVSLNYSFWDAIKSYVYLKVNIKALTAENFEASLVNLTNGLKGTAKDFAVFYFYKYLLDKKLLFLKSKLDLLQKYCTDKDYVSYINGYTYFTKLDEGNGNETKKTLKRTSDVILDINQRKNKSFADY